MSGVCVCLCSVCVCIHVYVCVVYVHVSARVCSLTWRPEVNVESLSLHLFFLKQGLSLNRDLLFQLDWLTSDSGRAARLPFLALGHRCVLLCPGFLSILGI